MMSCLCSSGVNDVIFINWMTHHMELLSEIITGKIRLHDGAQGPR